MKAIAKVIAMVLLALLMISCSPQSSRECKEVAKLVIEHIAVGTEEKALERFFAQQHLAPTKTRVSPYGTQFLVTIPVKGDKGHTIVIEVWVTDAHVVKSVKIFDAYTEL